MNNTNFDYTDPAMIVIHEELLPDGVSALDIYEALTVDYRVINEMVARLKAEHTAELERLRARVGNLMATVNVCEELVEAAWDVPETQDIGEYHVSDLWVAVRRAEMALSLLRHGDDSLYASQFKLAPDGLALNIPDAGLAPLSAQERES